MRFIVAVLLLFVIGVTILAAPPATDDAIFDEVRRKLANDPDVKGGGTIDVDVKDGVVTLKGKVRTEKAKAKAERVAKKAKGVKSVVNQLVVSST